MINQVPYRGFPTKPCPICKGSTKEPWKRYPYCKLCNPKKMKKTAEQEGRDPSPINPRYDNLFS